MEYDGQLLNDLKGITKKLDITENFNTDGEHTSTIIVNGGSATTLIYDLNNDRWINDSLLSPWANSEIKEALQKQRNRNKELRKKKNVSQGDVAKAKAQHNLDREINDKYKHVADTITDGFRCFFLGIHKDKDGDLGFHGKDDNPDLTQWGPELPLPQLPPFPDEKLQLKEQVSYLKDRNETLENKNAKLEGELSAYRQMLNILSKEHQDEN